MVMNAIAYSDAKDTGLSITGQMQIISRDPSASRVFETVDVLLQSCDGGSPGIRVFEDGENESQDQPNIKAGECITLAKSSVPFDIIRQQETVGNEGEANSDNYRLVTIEAYIDARQSVPSLDLSHCGADNSTFFFNKSNPRESYARCEYRVDQGAAKGIAVKSPANIYLLLFHYAGKSESLELPAVTVILGLVN